MVAMKMPFIEGIGDEVTIVFSIIVFIIIIYFAWCSTNVRDDRLHRTALLIIENNHRREIERVTYNPVTIIRTLSSQSNVSNTSNTTEEFEIADDDNTRQIIDNIDDSLQAASLNTILDNDLTAQQRVELNEQFSINNRGFLDTLDTSVGTVVDGSPTTTLTNTETSSDFGPQDIIREMDNESTEGLRRRRVAFYTNNNDETSNSDTTPTTNNNDTINKNDDIGDGFTNKNDSNTSAVNVASTTEFPVTNNDNFDNKNKNSIAEITEITNDNKNIVNDLLLLDKEKKEKINLNETIAIEKTTSIDDIRVKLKYLNDDMRMVKGKLTEAIGDFKKRNFTVEYAAQKLVRLVFNGHVLQPDTKTLQSCGLFDNCVVHCLVHNPRNINLQQQLINQQQPNANNINNLGIHGGIANLNTRNNLIGNNNNNNNNINNNNNNNNNIDNNNHNEYENDQIYLYIVFFVISLALLFCWYYRFEYNELFTWYSTLELAVLTTVFIVGFALLIIILN